MWGCDKLDFLVDSGVIADSASQKIVCNNWGFFMKELWRNYYITPRSDCSTASDLSEAGINCGYECSKAAANDMPATLKGQSSPCPTVHHILLHYSNTL